jgi:uncharacterized protein
LNKHKIFNDPVYGFVNVPYEIIYDLIEHPYFQRLRYIKQLGLTHLVYPGALHTRFHHALGALHLTTQALEILSQKGIEISSEEKKAVSIAILLHDIGHGPFSHALENCLIPNISHEQISLEMMEVLNEEFKGELSLAIQIFKNVYPRKFLHSLISGQLDMDRMDYLNRDSFYTGVSEGVIGFDRILKMLIVHNDALMIEEKGVYYHKSVLSAELMLIQILNRAKHLAAQDIDLFCTPALSYFLYNNISIDEIKNNRHHLNTFAALDDSDIHTSIKQWQFHSDEILSKLCRMIIQRKLYKVEIQSQAFDPKAIASKTETLQIPNGKEPYFNFLGSISNTAYDLSTGSINILLKNQRTIDITEASDNLNLHSLSSKVVKQYWAYLPMRYTSI